MKNRSLFASPLASVLLLAASAFATGDPPHHERGVEVLAASAPQHFALEAGASLDRAEGWTASSVSALPEASAIALHPASSVDQVEAEPAVASRCPGDVLALPATDRDRPTLSRGPVAPRLSPGLQAARERSLRSPLDPAALVPAPFDPGAHGPADASPQAVAVVLPPRPAAARCPGRPPIGVLLSHSHGLLALHPLTAATAAEDRA